MRIIATACEKQEITTADWEMTSYGREVKSILVCFERHLVYEG